MTLNVLGGLDLMRHPGGGPFTAIVNSDGKLIVGGTLYLTYNIGRDGILDVNGGRVEVGGNLESLDNHTLSGLSLSKILLHDGGTVDVAGAVTNTLGYGATIDFLDLSGASFTAAFGGDFGNIAAVQSAVGDVFVSSAGLNVRAFDNADGTYTVTAVPEPSGIALSAAGLLGLALLGRRRRKRRPCPVATGRDR